MSAVDLSLEDIIAKDRRGKPKAEGPKGKGKSRARSTLVKTTIRKAAPVGASVGVRGSGRKPPPAGAAELREMRAFGRARAAPAQGQGKAKGKGSWKGDAGRDSGSGGTWGKVKGGLGGKGKRAALRYEPYGGGKDSFRGGKGKGAAWDDSWSSGWAAPREAASGTKRVVIGNLDFGIMAEDLEELFAGFGVQRAWIDYDSTDRSLGTGGAIFADPGAAVSACRRYHGSMIDGQTVYMELDSSKGKGKGKGKDGKGKGKPW